MTARDPFVLLPVEPADAWFKLESPDRFLGAAMFTVFGNDEVLHVPIADAPDVVVKRLHVDSRHRPTARRALERIQKAGLLVADGEVTRLLYSRHAHFTWYSEHPVNAPSPNGEPSANGQRTDGQQTANEPPANRETKPSAGKDSGRVTHKERRKQERKKHTPRGGAREATPELLWRGEVEGRFAALCIEAGLGDPSMSGRKVAAFPGRLRNTARSMQRAELELLEQAFKLWHEDGCDGSDVASPYAAFVERFTRLVAPPANGRANGYQRASSAEEHAGGTNGRSVFGAMP